MRAICGGRLRRTLIAAAVVSATGLAQTACGTTAAVAATHTVVIAEMKFVPGSLTVKRGDTIVWVNRDYFPHTATAQDHSFDSKEIATNKTWSYVAKTGGTFPYICTLHPTMKGALIVK